MRFLIWLLVNAALPNKKKGIQELHFEILALRQQLHAFKLKEIKPNISIWDRCFWVFLSKLWPEWKSICLIVRPETVIAWHRLGFRLFWKWKSRKTKPSSKRKELIEIISQMARDNPRWGAPRIHGELLKLGFRVSERTVSRLMPKKAKTRQTLEKQRQNWKTFLANHRDVITAMDFLVVPTWNFKPLYILVIIDHGRRIIRHFNVTAHPTAEWVKQQLREAFPFGDIPKYLIFDRDTTLAATKQLIKAMGIKPKNTAYHCPWQNGVCERMNGTLRRELLDHVIALNEDHLRRVIKEYLLYYHNDRTHLGLNKDGPRGRPIEAKPGESAKLKGLPRCGGLHHRYIWEQAA